jgi:Na+-driven multidrug efflux pump
LVLIVILDFTLIPRYGIAGAAVASTFARGAEFVVIGWLFVHHSELSWRKLFSFRRSDFDFYLGLLPEFRKSLKLTD